MSSRFPALLLAAFLPLFAQDAKPQAPPAKNQQEELKRHRTEPATSDKEEVPPEEDASLSTKEYSFNPLQSKKDVDVGNEYFKKHSYRAAAGRFREATKWNDQNSEAWLRLGEAEEKLRDPKAAREAYTKYLAVASDAKNASEIRKKLEKLK
jgi:tetratricopeptide (TPR) repeat protein